MSIRRVYGACAVVFLMGVVAFSSTVSAAITGQDSERLGTSLVGLGDQDADGFEELAAGAPGASNGAAGEAGAVYVFRGAVDFETLSLTSANADLVIRGVTANGHLGQSVGATDFNGNGKLELLVGEPDSAEGRVYVIPDSLIASQMAGDKLIQVNEQGVGIITIKGESVGDRFGAALQQRTADADGDGRGDLLVGAPQRSGPRTTLYDGWEDGEYSQGIAWTQHDGNLRVENGELRQVAGGTESISTPSAQAYGAWEVKFRHGIDSGYYNSILRFYFIGNDGAFGPGSSTAKGYYLFANTIYSPDLVCLYRDDGGSSSNVFAIGCTQNYDVVWPAQNDLKVVRYPNNHFHVFLNGLKILSGTDSTYTTSKFIGFRNSADTSASSVFVDWLKASTLAPENLFDDFDDEFLAANPTWTEYPANTWSASSQELRQTVTGTARISASADLNDGTWSARFKHGTDLSTTSSIMRFYLYFKDAADTGDTSTIDGYYIYSNSKDDQLSLVKQVNGVITALVSTTWADDISYHEVKVIRNSGNYWQVYLDGQFRMDHTETTSTGTITAPDSGMRIGFRNQADTTTAIVKVDDVKIPEGLTQHGASYLLLARETLNNRNAGTADLIRFGTRSNDHFGSAVSTSSVADLLVGAPDADFCCEAADSGFAEFVRGSSLEKVAYFNDFDGTEYGVNTGGAWGPAPNTEWELGTPVQNAQVFDNPDGDHTTGTGNAWGTDLDNFYSISYGDQNLFSPTFDLTAMSSARLVMWHAYWVEADYDFIRVSATKNGGVTYTELYATTDHSPLEPPLTGELTWVRLVVPLTGFTGVGTSQVQLRFTLDQDAVYVANGWYIDDVAIVGRSALQIDVSSFLGQAGERSGASVALGDVSTDGLVEALVGGPGWASETGRVKIYLSASAASAPHIIAGPTAGSEFGASLALVRDSNQDASNDFAVGAPGHGTDAGRTYLFGGSVSLPSATSQAILAFDFQGIRRGGSAVAGVNMNGDAFEEAAAGGPGPEAIGGNPTGLVIVLAGIDSDLDGLPNGEELGLGTDLYDPDSDDDGLKDGEEKAYWDNHPISAWNANPDNDFLGGNPSKPLYNLIDPDSDADGLIDGDEAMDVAPVDFMWGAQNSVIPDSGSAISLSRNGIRVSGSALAVLSIGFRSTTISSVEIQIRRDPEPNRVVASNFQVAVGSDPVLQRAVLGSNPAVADMDGQKYLASDLTALSTWTVTLRDLHPGDSQSPIAIFVRIGVIAFSDAANPDSDGDTLRDGWDDLNNDGLKQSGENPGELEFGTLPVTQDTDQDDLTDSQELVGWSVQARINGVLQNLGTKVPDPSNPDTDFDGLKDGQESTAGTDPTSPDTDADRLPDGSEAFSQFFRTTKRIPIAEGGSAPPVILADVKVDGPAAISAEVWFAVEHENSLSQVSVKLRRGSGAEIVLLSAGAGSGTYLADHRSLIAPGMFQGADFLATSDWALNVQDLDNNPKRTYVQYFEIHVVGSTDSLDDDSDGDQLTDGEEASPGDDGWFTNPRNAHTDGDLLTDGQEVLTDFDLARPGVQGTNPTNADTDRDGVLDNNDIDPLHDLFLTGWFHSLTSIQGTDWDDLVSLNFIPDPFVTVNMGGGVSYSPAYANSPSITPDQFFSINIPDDDDSQTVDFRAYDLDVVDYAFSWDDFDSINIAEESNVFSISVTVSTFGPKTWHQWTSTGTPTSGVPLYATADVRLMLTWPTRSNTLLLAPDDGFSTSPLAGGGIRYTGAEAVMIAYVDYSGVDSHPLLESKLNAVVVPLHLFSESQMAADLQYTTNPQSLPAYLSDADNQLHARQSGDLSSRSVQYAITMQINSYQDAEALLTALKTAATGGAILGGYIEIASEDLATFGLPIDVHRMTAYDTLLNSPSRRPTDICLLCNVWTELEQAVASIDSGLVSTEDFLQHFGSGFGAIVVGLMNPAVWAAALAVVNAVIGFVTNVITILVNWARIFLAALSALVAGVIHSIWGALGLIGNSWSQPVQDLEWGVNVGGVLANDERYSLLTDADDKLKWESIRHPAGPAYPDDLEADFLRVDIPWKAHQPTESSPLLPPVGEGYRHILQSADDIHIKSVAILGHVPDWAKDWGRMHSKFSPEWNAFCGFVAYEYGDWIDYYEIFNEENHPWHAQTHGVDTAKLMASCIVAIKTVRPGAKIVLNSAVVIPLWDHFLRDRTTEVIAESAKLGISNPVDILAVDLYPGTWDGKPFPTDWSALPVLFGLVDEFSTPTHLMEAAIMETGASCNSFLMFLRDECEHNALANQVSFVYMGLGLAKHIMRERNSLVGVGHIRLANIFTLLDHHGAFPPIEGLFGFQTYPRFSDPTLVAWQQKPAYPLLQRAFG